jgi:Alkylmercury lyase
VSETVDRDVRLFIYQRFVDDRTPPDAARVAEELGLSTEEAQASFRRLEASRVLVLAPGTLNIWMANPLCAYPTPFRVTTTAGSWWGTCVWDAFGIPAMLGSDGVIETSDPTTSESFELHIEDGVLRPVEAVAHFAVPARRWWENIGYT